MEKETEVNLSIQRTGKNYDKRFIKAIVSLVEEGAQRREVCKQYNLGATTLDDWMKVYGSREYQQTKRQSYSKLQKRTIVTAIEEGHMSLEEARVAYRIKSTKLIQGWLRQFKKEIPDLCEVNHADMAPEKANDTGEVQALKKALEEAQLKIKALNTMIDVAEEQLKIDI